MVDSGPISGSMASPEAPSDLRPSGYDPGQGLSLNSVLRFGKYRGLTVGAVARFNPRYLTWAEESLDRFALDSEARKVVWQEARAAERFSINQQDAWAWGFGRDAKAARERRNARLIKIEHEERRKAGQECHIGPCGRIEWRVK